MIIDRLFHNVECDHCGALLDEETWWDDKEAHVREILSRTIGIRQARKRAWPRHGPRDSRQALQGENRLPFRSRKRHDIHSDAAARRDTGKRLKASAPSRPNSKEAPIGQTERGFVIQQRPPSRAALFSTPTNHSISKLTHSQLLHSPTSSLPLVCHQPLKAMYLLDVVILLRHCHSHSPSFSNLSA